MVQELKFPCFVAAVQFSQLMPLTWCLCTHNEDTDTKMYRKRRAFSAWRARNLFFKPVGGKVAGCSQMCRVVNQRLHLQQRHSIHRPIRSTRRTGKFKLPPWYKGKGWMEPSPSRLFDRLQYFETILPSVESLWSSLQGEVDFMGGGTSPAEGPVTSPTMVTILDFTKN